MDATKAKGALELACELDEVAKSVPVEVETLLALIEPPSGSLRELKLADAAAHLRELDSVLSGSEPLRKALARLIPSETERDRISNCRTDMREFYERISKIPRTKRRGERKSALRTELEEIYSRWPESRFKFGLIDPSVEEMFQRTLGDLAWLVSALDDQEHTDARKRLLGDGTCLDKVSPLRAWRLCPQDCRRCWNLLRDRMRRAISRLEAGDLVSAGDLIMKKVAAQILGTGPEQISRWRNDPPGWAESDLERLNYLLEEFGGCLLRSRIEELARWRKEAGIG